jgi:hypothetical protein
MSALLPYYLISDVVGRRLESTEESTDLSLVFPSFLKDDDDDPIEFCFCFANDSRESSQESRRDEMMVNESRDPPVKEWKRRTGSQKVYLMMSDVSMKDEEREPLFLFFVFNHNVSRERCSSSFHDILWVFLLL